MAKTRPHFSSCSLPSFKFLVESSWDRMGEGGDEERPTGGGQKGGVEAKKGG